MKVLDGRGEKGLWVAIVADEFFRYANEILPKLQKFL